jgi:hypothetical protein
VRFLPRLLTAALITSAAASPAAAGEAFYREPGLFSTRPDETKSLTTIDRFGPVGIGIELHQPAFVMKVKNVEEGSPAAATGKLAKGQVIESINGRKLAGIDPRIQLGEILAAAEASDGKIRLVVRGDAAGAASEEVVVSIPVLGRYAATWPLDCPKSENIVRGFADYLARPGSDVGFSGVGMLFLLSTGEERDLEPVRKWVHACADKPAPTYAWQLGYGGIPLCEYYLRTGDATALPIIQKWAESARKAEYLDAWAGRGGVTSVSYGNGHLNAGGTAVVTFLQLAKQCGADVDESLLRRTLVHFFRFAGRGNNPYGDDRPETSFVDNGKNGNLAFAMAAAAGLTPAGERSPYARARDIAAMSSFYTTTYMLHGHTGGGIGEIWRSAAMGLLHDKKPLQYRQFMDGRRWHYDLSRRFNGSFGILGGAGYDKEEWGAAYALTYTIPRKTLRITGAASKFAKAHPLPERPWGTAADDAFLSLEPAAGQDGTRQDVSGERLAEHSGKPLIERLAATEVGDDELRRLVRHPEYLIRHMAANHAAGFTFAYMFNKREKPVRPELLAELRSDPDPRVRSAGFRATVAGFDPAAPWAARAFADALARLADQEESWWIKDAALAVVARATPDMIAPHVDVLLPYLDHPEQWLQNGALGALVPVVADDRCFTKVLPAVGQLLRTCERWSTTGGPTHAIRERLQKAGPAVQELAATTLREVYTRYAGVKTWAGGQNITSVYDSHLESLASILADVPGGYDIVYEVAKQRYPHQSLPYAKLFLAADPAKLSPALREKIAPIVREQLISEYMARNRPGLLAAAAARKQGPPSAYLVSPLDGLVDLYRTLGVADYDWREFGDSLADAEWEYLMFDPPEQQAYDLSPWRYRKVTLPGGMEQWFDPGFDAARAGWKKGQAPFGQYAGKLVTDAEACGHAFKGATGLTGMRTFWDKEVLLVRGRFGFPSPEPGYIYRIRILTGDQVGVGDGYRLYVNGRLLTEIQQGVGRREGGKPRGGFIAEDFVSEFGKGPVTLAATTFLRYGNRAIVTMPPVPQGIFSLRLEQMKLPPLNDEAFRKAAVHVPLLSSAWQARQSPESDEPTGDDDRYRYDGGFAPNPAVVGNWKTVAVVPTIEAFDPAKPVDAHRAPFKTITFADGGRTDSGVRVWTGDTLIDLDRFQALKLVARAVAGDDCLFIEAGGFSDRHPAGWTSPWIVLRRQ